MNWVVAGLIAGVIVYVVDYVMWGKVFTKGLDVFVTAMTPDEMKRFMGPALVKSALISKATRRKDAKNRCVKTES